MNDLDICLAAGEYYQEQDQLSGHPDDLISLLSIPLDEVIIAHHVIWILEDLRGCLERDSMDPLVPSGLDGIPRESHTHITLLYIQTVCARVIGNDCG